VVLILINTHLKTYLIHPHEAQTRLKISLSVSLLLSASPARETRKKTWASHARAPALSLSNPRSLAREKIMQAESAIFWGKIQPRALYSGSRSSFAM